MSKYFFHVEKKDMRINRSERWYIKKSKFDTSINIEGNKLKIALDRKNGRFNRKHNSFTEGMKKIDISEILSINFKIGYAIDFNIHQICFILIIIMALLGVIGCIPHLWRQIIYGLVRSPLELNILPLLIFIIAMVSSLSNLTFKCVQIKYKEDNVISSKGYKKFVFPISGLFFYPMTRNEKKVFNAFIKEIQENNVDIKVKKDNLTKGFVILLIIFLLVVISAPIIAVYN